jgi:hypothetical protein
LFAKSEKLLVKEYEYSKKERLKDSMPCESGLFQGIIYICI